MQRVPRNLDAATYAELNRLEAIASTQAVIQWPQIDEETLEAFKSLDPDNETLQDLLSMAPYPVKMSRFDGCGAMQYQTSVPASLTNVIVFDASEPIRDLAKYDRLMRRAEDFLPSMSTEVLGVPLSRIKQHDNVAIYQMKLGSGKHTMRQSFAKTRKDERLVIKEVIYALKNFVCEDEAVSIIVFKPVADPFGKRVDFQKVLETDLENAGIDLNETVPVLINGKTELRPRICITTWGKHTATNDWSHCTNQFQIGILHRDTLDLMGNANGQMGSYAELTYQQLQDLQLSEVAHCSYQAMNRTNMRNVENGQAKRANIWLFHDSDNLQRKLEPVLEGAGWYQWTKRYDHPEKPKRTYHRPVTTSAAIAIRTFLDTLPTTTEKVSFKELKLKTGLTGLDSGVFQGAVTLALKETQDGWIRQGRGVVRANVLFSIAS